MSISPEQEALIGRVFETYLKDHHHGDILQLIADTDEEIHRTVVINAMTLFEANMEIGDYFNAFPNDVLAIFDKVLHKTTVELSETSSPRHSGGQRTKVHRLSHTPHARITGLPVCPELTRDTVPRSRDVGHFLSVTGTVIRTSITKVLEYERDYMCAKCRHVFTVEADFDQFYTFIQPTACPNSDGCNSYKFTCLSGGSEPAVCRDYQEIKIQEQVQRLSVGSVPRSMVVVLEDDLVDSCKSGDDVTVYGVMCQRWKPFYDSTRCDVELVLKANNIEVNNQHASAALVMKDAQKEFEDFWDSYKHDPIAGRNQILLSLCPQVFGMYLIKLAVAMVLAGGVQRVDSSGTKIRGECHMLLVGDPGTGKSQFLKYAAKIMPRSVLTAGIGSTSAGLTVTAVKDGGEWHLEAGALVLSDGGLCCIDEFNSIKEHDRISIHEAMEQQSISVAKAGIVCKLNTRTTILAATNPKGQYDPNEPLSVNVALASPLLSRFDLVLVLLDTRNAEWDRVISSFILEDRGLSAESSSLWSLEKMKAYFSVIKRLKPQVSDDANSILARYYQLQRQSGDRNAARTTIRMLESLSRLAEAHARLMYRETVTIEDAVTAVSVMECSMQGGALLGNVNALLTSFPADPGRQYETQCQVLLEGLNLPLLLQKEMDRLASLKRKTSEDSPPAEPRDTNAINKTHDQDITSNCSGNGLDWFQDISQSVSPDYMVRPSITSTQENPNRKQNLSEMSAVSKESNCRTEKHTGSTLNYDVPSNPVSRITSAAEENNQTKVKIGTMTEKTSLAEEKIKQSERLRDKPHTQLSTCVVQKVSKNLRERRLRELEQNHQECDNEEGGGHQECTSVTADTTSDSGSSSSLFPSKTFSSNNHIRDNQPSARMEEKRDQAKTKNLSAVLREKMEAEADASKDLRAQLSDFIFKPKKMRAPLRNINACSDLSVEGNPGSSHTLGRMRKQTPVGHEEDGLTDTKRNKRQKNTEEHSGRLRQISCVGGERANRSEAISPELDMEVFSFGQDKLPQREIKERDDSENLCQQQRTGVNTAVESEVDRSTHLKPSLSAAQSKSGHGKTTVASSTLAKLSRFSFTAVETIAEKSPPKRHSVECLNGDKNPPECNQAVKRFKTLDSVCTVSDVFPPPATERKSTTESLTKTMSECKGKDKLMGPVHAANQSKTVETGSEGCADYQSTVNLKKRKCFELGPPPASGGTSRGLFAGLSLFDSVDVLDTDWDQELSNTAKGLKT